MTTTFTKWSLVKGQPAQLNCVDIAGQTFILSGGILSTVRLEDEWYEDVRQPSDVSEALRMANLNADIFTFWQRLPDVDPHFDYHCEFESIAALRVNSFDHWWNRQIKPRTRTLIRKAQKLIEVREVTYDDAFVRGMTEIFNETPVRQGRRFWHYGKTFDTVKQQFARYLHRENLVAAYYNGEFIGFMMLGNAGCYAVTGQIISKIAHRDKATNTLLIAKAVEICEAKGFPYLVYFHWGNGSLAEFKRRCGFEPTRIPRFYIALTTKGAIALRLGLHRGWKNCLPSAVTISLRNLRRRWLDVWHANGKEGACRG